MRKNKPQNLNEELNRMRRLMEFNIGEHSHEVLAEQKFKKSVISEQANSYAASQREFMRLSQKNFYHYFWVKPKSETVKIDVEDIKANFYNNMVTLEKGLMPQTPIESVRQQIQDIIKKIKEEGYDESSLKINIIGTASSAPASEYADERLGDKVPVDHRGTPYNGQDPNNDYLAKERAKSIYSVFKKLLPNAKYTVSSKIIEGGAGEEGDPVRFIKLDITGSKKTGKEITSADSYLNFDFSYQEGEGFTTMEALQAAMGEELANKEPAKFGGGPFKTYTAKLEINFGQKVPQFSGSFVMVSADQDPGGKGVEGKTVYKHSYIPNVDKQNRTMAILGKPNTWNVAPTKTLNASNKLRFFLVSSGYFTFDQVNEILSGLNDPNGNILGKLKGKKGDFKTFVSLMGGNSEQTIDSNTAKYAIIDDTIRKTIKQIK